MSDVVRADVVERFNGGVRPCRYCGSEIRKNGGCYFVRCPNCSRGQCWYCGKVIVDTWEACLNHGCAPNNLLEWEVSRLQFPEQRTQRGNQVIVTTQTGVVVTVLYSPDWTVAQLKQAIQMKTGISVSQMATLTYGGRSLSDGVRLAQCAIRNRSTVVLTTTVAGG
jgi:hypothetical protein